MRAFVTGGAGFLGSALVDRLLAEGHRVDVVDDLSRGSLANLADARRDPDHDLHFQRLDITSDALGDILCRRRPEVVYHLASWPLEQAAWDDAAGDAAVTVGGTLRVLNACRRAEVRKVVVALPASLRYGDDPLPSREGSPSVPTVAPAIARASIAEYLAAHREHHSLEFTALAVGTVYGPRQRRTGDDGVVMGLVRDHLAGSEAVVAGPAASTRDLVFVDDVVDALARAADRGSGLVLNVGTGVETALRDLVTAVARATGTEVAVRHTGALPGMAPRRCLDVGRAAIHLGWQPWTDVATGVAAVVDRVRTEG